MPFGGIRMVKKSVDLYGKNLDKNVEEFFTKYRKTHNDGVFDAILKILERKNYRINYRLQMLMVEEELLRLQKSCSIRSRYFNSRKN